MSRQAFRDPHVEHASGPWKSRFLVVRRGVILPPMLTVDYDFPRLAAPLALTADRLHDVVKFASRRRQKYKGPADG